MGPTYRWLANELANERKTSCKSSFRRGLENRRTREGAGGSRTRRATDAVEWLGVCVSDIPFRGRRRGATPARRHARRRQRRAFSVLSDRRQHPPPTARSGALPVLDARIVICRHATVNVGVVSARGIDTTVTGADGARGSEASFVLGRRITLTNCAGCQTRQALRVRMRVQTCLRSLPFAAVRCNPEPRRLQHLSVQRSSRQLVQLDF
jgi:hypothetical protein